MLDGPLSHPRDPRSATTDGHLCLVAPDGRSGEQLAALARAGVRAPCLATLAPPDLPTAGAR